MKINTSYIFFIFALLSCNSKLVNPSKSEGDTDKTTEDVNKNPDEVITVTAPVDVSGTFLTSATIATPKDGIGNYIIGVSLFCDQNSRIICDINTLNPNLKTFEACKILKDKVEVTAISKKLASSPTAFWQYEVELTADNYLKDHMSVVCSEDDKVLVKGEAKIGTFSVKQATFIDHDPSNQMYHDKAEHLTVGRNEMKILLQFAMSAIPVSAVVKEAKLELFLYDQTTNAYFLPVAPYRLVRDWVAAEASDTHRKNNAEWSPSQSPHNFLGPKPDFDYDPHIESVVTLNEFKQQNPNGMVITFDITKMVINWVIQPQNNFGLILKDLDGFGENNTHFVFCSEERSASGACAVENNRAPKLVITYY